jgi:oligopeptide/dipeptide ABC transporter ATP-binding protein
VCQRVAVMYLGKIVEMGTTAQVFRNAQHPYTRALLSAAPIAAYGRRRERLTLKGEIPSPLNLPSGCRLYGRCPEAINICSTRHPALEEIAHRHLVACYVAHQRARHASPAATEEQVSATVDSYRPSTHHKEGGAA